MSNRKTVFLTITIGIVVNAILSVFINEISEKIDIPLYYSIIGSIITVLVCAYFVGEQDRNKNVNMTPEVTYKSKSNINLDYSKNEPSIIASDKKTTTITDKILGGLTGAICGVLCSVIAVWFCSINSQGSPPLWTINGYSEMNYKIIYFSKIGILLCGIAGVLGEIKPNGMNIIEKTGAKIFGSLAVGVIAGFLNIGLAMVFATIVFPNYDANVYNPMTQGINGYVITVFIYAEIISISAHLIFYPKVIDLLGR